MDTNRNAPAATGAQTSTAIVENTTSYFPVVPQTKPKLIPESIPLELRELHQWVPWKYETSPSGRLAKVPYNATSGRMASVVDPSTWTDFDTAVRVSFTPGYAGIGFVLTENDPYTVIDLDNKPDNPAPPDELETHKNILAKCESYTETSPSGYGQHVVVLGKLPVPGMRRGHVEVYSSKRFLAFTGNVTRQIGITNCQQVLDHLVNLMKPSGATQVQLEEEEEDFDDATVCEMASEAANGAKYLALCKIGYKGSAFEGWQFDQANVLPDCKAMGYPSQSEADSALISMLCFRTRSNEQVKRLFRYTGLGKRPKASADDRYLDRTIVFIRSTMLSKDKREQLERERVAFVQNLDGGKGLPTAAIETSRPVVPTVPPIPSRRGTPPAVKSAADLLTRDFGPVQWVLRDILPEGVTIFSGDPKVGKTWFAYQAAFAVATGSPLWAGRDPEQVGDVLLLALEENDRRLNRRFNSLMPRFSKWEAKDGVTKAIAPDISRIHYATAWPRAEDGIPYLEQQLVQYPGTRLVVIDTMGAFRDPEPGRKTAYAADYAAGEMFRPLASKYRVAILLVMHNRKMPTDDPLQLVSGTQGLTGSVDNVLVLQRRRGQMDAALTIEGRDIEEARNLALQFRDGFWSSTGKTVEEAQMSKERRKVLEIVEELGSGAASAAICEAMAPNSSGSVRKLLSIMVKAGELKNVDGIYSIPSYGR